jgi:hypothetical protein
MQSRRYSSRPAQSPPRSTAPSQGNAVPHSAMFADVLTRRHAFAMDLTIVPAPAHAQPRHVAAL